MNFTQLLKETLTKVRQSKPIVEGGHSIHVLMQDKGFESGLTSCNVSLLHAFNENQNLINQSSAVDFLRAENARLWDERASLINIQAQRQNEANQLAQRGYVSLSNDFERETNETVGRQIYVINTKLTGIRLALDHAIHAGGSLFEERCIQDLTQPNCYGKPYGDKYDQSVKLPIQ